MVDNPEIAQTQFQNFSVHPYRHTKLIQFIRQGVVTHSKQSQLRQFNQYFKMKIRKLVFLAAFLTIIGINQGKSQGLGDLLNGGLGSTLGNVIEGVFSSSDISIADMAGEWTSDGPAVCFQGEGFLKKAGGVAAAAAIESKLAPYYEQYGLNNAKLTVTEDGKFTLVLKQLKLSGTITKPANSEAGVFEFNFTALNMKLALVTTYVEKTSSTMDVMFDATKLKKLLSAVAQFSGIQIVQTVSGILDSYDGLCVGFHFSGKSTNTGTGSTLGNILNGLSGGSKSSTSTGSGSKGTSTGTTTKSSDKTSSGAGDAISNGINALKGILNGGK